MKNSVYMTRGIKNCIDEGEINPYILRISLSRFDSNYWGELCKDDTELQNELLKEKNSKIDNRFIGSYTSNQTKFWIISEYDYTEKTLITTILLPEEY